MSDAPQAAAGPIKGCVLAAGFGQRMAPITEHVPKPLLPVGHVPLIGYALRLLAHHGITDVVINVHHLGRLIREALGDGEAFGVRLTYSVEEEILGTGGGLKNMHPQLDTTFVLLNSDTVMDLDLHALTAAHRATGALATMVLRRDLGGRAPEVEVEADGRVGRILRQGPHRGPLTGYAFAGAHVIEPRFLEYLPPQVQTCLIRYGYLKALANDEPIYGHVSDGYWRDAGTPAAYYRAHQDALNQAMPLRHLDPLGGYALTPRREVAEAVRMGDAVDLGSEARLVPPVLLGDGARLGERAQVGPLVALGQKVTVGKGAEVARSVLLDGVKVDAGDKVDGQLVGRRGSLSLLDGGGA